MILHFQWISGCMVGIEFITGGLVLDLAILRLMILSPNSPYIDYED